ncbi:MAG: hypothetical protein ABIR59_03635 [Gemmatimonadales bacterium]
MKGVFLILAIVGISAGGPARPHTSSPESAAPRIIMLYGGVLKEPIYLTDWRENLDFMLAVSEPVSGAAALPSDSTQHIEVAMYWYGPTWEPYVQDTTRLRTLDPKDAQRSRIYLGHANLRPLLVFPGATSARRIAAKGIEILSKYHVRTEW